jgi:3-oxoacyl-[acyl-carrier protein] reductase
MSDVVGKTAVVTGAAKGLGYAIAERLAADGARVAVADIDMPGAEEAAHGFAARGFEATAFSVDVALKASVIEMADRVRQTYGGVDILINNAGIVGPSKPLVDIEEEEWDRTLDVNLKGAFLCSQVVIPAMLEAGWGRIVNISSVAGRECNPNAAPYGVSKIGMIGLTMSLGRELAQTGITVTCVTPTVTRTEFVESVDPEIMAPVLAKIPMGRMAEPEEVAALVRFLVSEETAYMTAQVYDISGGRASY